MINVGCDAATTEQAIAVAAAHDGIFATAGLHPHEAKHGVDTIVAVHRRPQHRRHRRMRARLLLRPLAARRAARGVRRADPTRPRAIAAAGHPHPRRVGGDVRHPRCRRHARANHLPLLHRRARRGAAVPRPRRVPVVQRDRHVQDRDRPARGGAAVPDRSNAGRDRQPVPRAGAAPRQTEPAGLRHPRRRRRSPTCGAPRWTRCAPLRWRTHALRSRVFVRSLFHVPRTGTPHNEPIRPPSPRSGVHLHGGGAPGLVDHQSQRPGLGCARRSAPPACRRSAPTRHRSTSVYTPDPPIFLNGPPSGADPAVVDIIIPPGPTATEAKGRASFRRYADPQQGPCTTALAPWGSHLTVTNTDNGQTTTCVNSISTPLPAGVDIVLHTDRLRDDQRSRRRARAGAHQLVRRALAQRHRGAAERTRAGSAS